MTIDSNLINPISGPTAPVVRVGTSFAVTVGESVITTVTNAEPAKSTPDPAASSDHAEQIEHKDIVRLNDYVQNIRRRLEFRVDEATNRTVVTVIDQDTQEVIRQIPSAAALKLIQRPSDLLDDRAAPPASP